MSHRSKLLRVRALQLLSVLSLLLLVVDARAITASPSVSTNGNYVVSWGTPLGCTTEDLYPYYPQHCYSLQENGVDIAASGYSLSVTGKAAGSYEYRIYYRMSVYGSPYDEYPVEGPMSVIVGTPPPRDTLPTQLTYQFQTRAGDINYDGRTDVFVYRTSGGLAGNGVLDKVILVQNGSGGFYSWVPDPSSVSTASSWPVAGSVYLEDFNVDGYADIEVKGVSGLTGGQVPDNQIVYSSGVPLQTQPLGVRAVDASLKQFVGNAVDYYFDGNYFKNYAAVHYYSGNYYYYYCSYYPYYAGVIDSYFYGAWYSCSISYIPIYGSYWDYSGFSEQAVAVWTNADAAKAGNATDAQATEAQQQAAENVLGVPIGGWPAEEEMGPTGEHTDPDNRKALETFWSIIGIAQANAQDITQVEAPSQTAQVFNVVFLAGHPVWRYFSMHTNLSYTSAITPWQTLGAGPSPYPVFGPYLKSDLNRGTDHDRRNITLGTVVDPGNPVAESYWAELKSADLKYNDDLFYDVIPNVGDSYYNSNGYTNGLVIATGGIPSRDITQYVGGWKPVPASKFQ